MMLGPWVTSAEHAGAPAPNGLARIADDGADDTSADAGGLLVFADVGVRRGRNPAAARRHRHYSRREPPRGGRRQDRETRNAREHIDAGGLRLRIERGNAGDEIRAVSEVEIMDALGD